MLSTRTTIHTEVETNDIAKVQEHFNSDCAYYFAEAIRDAVSLKHYLRSFNTNIVESGEKS